jgi:TM2 domain-containing membrane protein YozV
MQERDGGEEACKPQIQATIAKDGRASFLLATYACWLFLGIFGLHRIYARKTRSGVAMLSVCLGGWFLVLSGGIGVVAGWLFTPAGAADAGSVGLAGWGLGIGVGLVCVNALWWLVDAVLIAMWRP